MSDGKSPTPTTSNEPQGVMSSLPKTRPQRASARREAARARKSPAKPAAKPEGKAAAKSAEPAAKPASKPASKRKPAAKREPAPKPPPAPRQGFEAENDLASGKPVAPPSGVELAESLVELVGELAQGVVRSGERALRDALGRLRP